MEPEFSKPIEMSDLEKLREESYLPSETPNGWIVHGKLLGHTNSITALLFAFKITVNPFEREFLFWHIAKEWLGIDRNSQSKNDLNTIFNLCHNHHIVTSPSEILSAWALVSWACNPSNTTILLLSSEESAMKNPVFQNLLSLIPIEDLPWASVDTKRGVIKPIAEGFSSGIYCYSTCEKLKHRERLLGYKAPRVFLFSEVVPDDRVVGNLKCNPFFQMVIISKFAPCHL